MKFKITYECPETNETKTHTDDYDSVEWAKDHAYALADKGPYRVDRVVAEPPRNEVRIGNRVNAVDLVVTCGTVRIK